MANNVTATSGSGTTFKTTDTAGVHVGHVNVDTLPALAAGTNNIGDVDVLSIAAGDNNIGNVDVASIAAGDNNIGNVDIASALPAGTNNIGDVDVLTINGVAPAFGSGAVGATVQRVALATDSPGVITLGIAAASASAPFVLNKDAIKYVTVDMTAETTALDAGDVVAATQIVATCTPANDAPGILHSIVVIDPDDQGAELNLVFFSANTTLGTEDAAPDIDDTEVQTVLGIINVATTDYKDLGLSKVATIRNVGLPVLPATGTDDIYVAIFTPGTPTYAGGHIYLRLGFI